MPAPTLVLAACVLAAAGLAASFSARATGWAVMTDELQVVRLAISIAETLSPVPTVHGTYFGAHSQLYPLLLAPLYGALSAPDAATAARVLNGFLLASAALPAYLLARSVAGSRGAGYAAAALTAFTPWLVLAATLLTENAAYPAFAWAVYLVHRSMVAPGAARDLGALAGLLLAFLARTQLLVLALVLPVALLLHELGFALRRREPLRAAAARVLAEHRVLTVAYGAGAVVAALLAVQGSLGRIVGNYATPFSGDLLPSGLWSSAVAHLDQIVVGAGLVPFVLAVSWAVTSLARPERKEGHAFAALFVVVVPALTLQVASFTLRFTPGQFIQERYLFYLVPLLAVGAASWLAARTQLRLRLVTLALATALLVALLALASYDETLIFWASPAAAFEPALSGSAEALGLSTRTLLQLAAAVVVLAILPIAWRTPRLALVGVTLVLACFGVAQASYVFAREVEPALVRSYPEPRNWIDAAVPGGGSVALLPGGQEGPVPWWEAELWNEQVDRVLRVGRVPTFSPFPALAASVDYRRGRLVGPQPSEYVVLSASETRFRLVEAATLARSRALRLVRAPRPYRLQWATQGLTVDGWTRPDRLATVRLYGHGRSERRTVALTLAASRHSTERIDFVLRGGRSVSHGSVDPGGARPPVEVSTCVPADGYAELWLTSNGRTRLPGGRSVGLHIDALEVRAGGGCSRNGTGPSGPDQRPATGP